MIIDTLDNIDIYKKLSKDICEEHKILKEDNFNIKYKIKKTNYIITKYIFNKSKFISDKDMKKLY